MTPLRLTAPASQAFVALADAAGLSASLAAQAAGSARFVVGMAVPQAAWHAPILAVVHSQPVAGITLGTWIYLRSESHTRRWPLLVHELVHVVQALQVGTPRFLATYVWSWARLRSQGLTPWGAYEALADEVQARSVEQDARLSPSSPWLEAA